MKNVFEEILILIGACVVIFGIYYGAFEMYKFYAPRYEQVRYNTFKESQTYNDGMLRQIREAKREYEQANDEQKGAIKVFTLHSFDGYDIDRLPPDLKNFYDVLSGNGFNTTQESPGTWSNTKK